MKIAIAVIIGIDLLVYLVFVYTSIREEKRYNEWYNRALYPYMNPQNEKFNVELNIQYTVLTEFIEKERLPWRIAEIRCSPKTIEPTGYDGKVFEKPWKLMDWLESGGLCENGEKEYFASLKEEFHGMHVMFFFQRRTRKC